MTGPYTLPASAYGPALTCTPPPLRLMQGKVALPLPPAYTWTCPEEGAVWIVRAFISRGGLYSVQWMCLNPPGTPTDTTQARLTALEARATADESAATALTSRVSTLETSSTGAASQSSVTALTSRVATLESAAGSYATTSTVSALQTRVSAVETNYAALLTTVNAHTATITALTNRTVTVQRALPKATATIALGGTAAIPVTWKTAFPDTNYSVEALPVPALLSGLTVTSITGKTTTGAVVNVSSSVLVALGTALLDVTAVRYA